MVLFNPLVVWAPIAAPGHDPSFSPLKVAPITNDPEREFLNKPNGGLWTSPYLGPDAVSDWVRWCRGEMPHWVGPQYWVLRIDERAKIFHVGDAGDYLTLPRLKHFKSDAFLRKYKDAQMTVDFERLARAFDVLWVEPWDEWRFDPLIGTALNAWDVETVLIMNPKVIAGWSSREFNNQTHPTVDQLLSV